MNARKPTTVSPVRFASSPLSLDQSAVERFLAHCQCRRYPNRTDVFRPGDPAGTLYYVVNGSVSIIAEEEDGRELVLGYYGAGEFVGEMGLVFLHHPEDLAAALVGGRQGLEVLVQVGLDLALGFHHEAQVPAVAAQAGRGADRIAAGIPERVEQAGPAVEFAQAPGAPGQVVGLFLGGLQQVRAGGGVARHRGLAEIQALGADLADMVDPHQAGRVAAGGGGQHRVLGAGGVGPDGGRVAQGRFEGALGLDQEAVERGQVADGGHAGSGGGSSGPPGGPRRIVRPAASRCQAHGPHGLARVAGRLRRCAWAGIIPPLCCTLDNARRSSVRATRPRNQPDQRPEFP